MRLLNDSKAKLLDLGTKAMSTNKVDLVGYLDTNKFEFHTITKSLIPEIASELCGSSTNLIIDKSIIRLKHYTSFNSINYYHSIIDAIILF